MNYTAYSSIYVSVIFLNREYGLGEACPFQDKQPVGSVNTAR